MNKERAPLEMLKHLFESFSTEHLPPVKVMAGNTMPEPFRSLLDHEHHMTVTMEKHFAESVRVKVLSESIQGNNYSRILYLVGEKTGRIILFGAMRIRLDFLPKPAQQEILARKEPLGRILIRHEILRKLELVALLEINPFQDRSSWFDRSDTCNYFGRLAKIHVENQVAVEVFEVVSPEA